MTDVDANAAHCRIAKHTKNTPIYLVRERSLPCTRREVPGAVDAHACLPPCPNAPRSSAGGRTGSETTPAWTQASKSSGVGPTFWGFGGGGAGTPQVGSGHRLRKKSVPRTGVAICTGTCYMVHGINSGVPVDVCRDSDIIVAPLG